LGIYQRKVTVCTILLFVLAFLFGAIGVLDALLGLAEKGFGHDQLSATQPPLTPSLGVKEEAPPDMEKSGLIRFAMPATFQDQIERDQENIDRILRQFPTK
jgi:hypothetical protein